MKKKLLFLSVGIVFLLLLYFLSGWIRTAEQLKRLSDGSIPGSLVELYERNPEAWQFVLDYPAKKDQKEEIRLSGEITKGEIPLFLQWDERWGYETYGDDFLAVTGCGPTCLAMVSLCSRADGAAGGVLCAERRLFVGADDKRRRENGAFGKGTGV